MSNRSSQDEPAAERPRAVVLGVQLPDVDDAAFGASLDELERLAATLGLEIVGRVTQRRSALAADAVVGTGKLKELAGFTAGPGVVPRHAAPGRRAPQAQAPAEPVEPSTTAPATVVLVDHDLTPGQARNLERATAAEVLDRSMVIMSIFQRHARTREARMQVEIAQLCYLAPRLREASAGADRQRGGIGGKGAGESAIELDRRKIRDRIAELREKLEVVQREADARRSRRLDTTASSVALVGYTNAGKSSLMRGLTGDSVYVANQLFATLDTTVRVLIPETKPRILVSDTVGFIKKLPHDLVASFRSTLEEARDADLLLHVVDGSDPACRDQHQVTRSVLQEIGAGQTPHLLILNKADRLDAGQRAALLRDFPEALPISALSSADVRTLYDRIVRFFEANMQEAEFQVPYSEPRKVALLHERCLVLAEAYESDAVRMRVRAPAAVLGSLRAELAAPGPANTEARGRP